MAEPSAPPHPKGYWDQRGWLLLIAAVQFVGVNGATFLILFISQKLGIYSGGMDATALVVTGVLLTSLTTAILCVAILLPGRSAWGQFVRGGLCWIAVGLTGFMAFGWVIGEPAIPDVFAHVLIALAYAGAGWAQLRVGFRL
jgi:hypothetical protein